MAVALTKNTAPKKTKGEVNKNMLRESIITPRQAPYENILALNSAIGSRATGQILRADLPLGASE